MPSGKPGTRLGCLRARSVSCGNVSTDRNSRSPEVSAIELRGRRQGPGRRACLRRHAFPAAIRLGSSDSADDKHCSRDAEPLHRSIRPGRPSGTCGREAGREGPRPTAADSLSACANARRRDGRLYGVDPSMRMQQPAWIRFPRGGRCAVPGSYTLDGRGVRRPRDQASATKRWIAVMTAGALSDRMDGWIRVLMTACSTFPFSNGMGVERRASRGVCS